MILYFFLNAIIIFPINKYTKIKEKKNGQYRDRNKTSKKKKMTPTAQISSLNKFQLMALQ